MENNSPCLFKALTTSTISRVTTMSEWVWRDLFADRQGSVSPILFLEPKTAEQAALKTYLLALSTDSLIELAALASLGHPNDHSGYLTPSWCDACDLIKHSNKGHTEIAEKLLVSMSLPRDVRRGLARVAFPRNGQEMDGTHVTIN